MIEDKKLFSVLFGASIFGLLCIYLYSLALTKIQMTCLFIYLFLPIQILLNVAFFFIVIFIGLKLSKKVGLGAPILEKFLNGKQVVNFKSIVKISILWGVVTWLLISVAGSALVLYCPELMNLSKTIPVVWYYGLLASFYGGISEEVMLRFFLMTFFVWLFYKIKKTDLSVWFAILVSSIIFGISHLPATAKIVSLTMCVVSRAIFLNGIAGVIFGWLYWKKGLLSAIIAHFSVDIILHVLSPLIVLIFEK